MLKFCLVCPQSICRKIVDLWFHYSQRIICRYYYIVFYLVQMICKYIRENTNFIIRAFIFKAKQNKTMMRKSLSDNQFTKILIICNNYISFKKGKLNNYSVRNSTISFKY